jgi:hypothetical protein
MPILNNIANAFLGATQVEKIYRGVELIWPTFAYLLDEYQNATFAYSLRKLRSAYTGACLRVRRSSDNAEQDIGFVDNALDTASLLSFVGAGNGFVTTWYNQAQNTYNMVQTVADNQPTIVSAGSLITEGGKPAILYDGSNDGFVCTPVAFAVLTGSCSFFSVLKTSSTKGIQYWSGQNTRWAYIVQSGNTSAPIIGGTTLNVIAKNTAVQTLPTRNDWYLAFANNVRHISYLRFTPPTFWENLLLMNYSAFLLGGRSQEIVVYVANKDDDRLGIEANINDYFGVY